MKKHIDRAPTPISCAMNVTRVTSLPGIYYGFPTDLGKTIVNGAHKDVIELEKNSETVSRKWNGRYERM